MANIDYIKTAKPRTDGKAELIVRFYVSKTFRPQFKSGLFILPDKLVSLDNTDRCRRYKIDIPRKGKLNFAEVKELTEIDTRFALFLKRLQIICDRTEEKHKDELTKEWIESALRVINKYNVHDDAISYEKIVELLEKEVIEQEEEIRRANKRTFFDYMTDFRDNAKKKVNGKREGDKSEVWKRNFDVLSRALQRYEMFIRLLDTKRKGFVLDIDKMDKDTLEDIESYLRNESTLLEEYPSIFRKIPASTGHKPQPRGNNTICALFNKLKAFFNWLNEKGITANNPFTGYEGVTSEKYGTPYYITREERNHIADYNLSEYPAMEVQRDIFIFQCYVGCRVSDLMRLTANNVIEGAIEYIPAKTQGEKKDVIRVPLAARALALMERYKGVDRKGRLFPFISPQKYNKAIKEVFTRCEVTRNVTVLNPVTGKEEQRPINEVASSHMARRTFVGNLYKKVKDPNIIASMSGHSENSKAFNRYREIDDEVKKEVISLID